MKRENLIIVDNLIVSQSSYIMLEIVTTLRRLLLKKTIKIIVYSLFNSIA